MQAGETTRPENNLEFMWEEVWVSRAVVRAVKAGREGWPESRWLSWQVAGNQRGE